MQKQFLVVVTVAFIVLIASGVYVWQNNTSTTTLKTTTTSSTQKVNTALSRADVSNLEKNRLYTEKEGEYTNLPEPGKKLLWAILAPKCIDNPNSNYCNQWKYIVTSNSIIDFHDGILLFNKTNEKGGMSYEFYDIPQKKLVRQIPHFSNMRNNDFVIYVDTSTPGEQKLRYYRAGMSQFAPVPGSTILGDESYLYPVGMGFMNSKWSFSGNSLTVSIFRARSNSTETSLQKLREVVFNLNTVQ